MDTWGGQSPRPSEQVVIGVDNQAWGGGQCCPNRRSTWVSVQEWKKSLVLRLDLKRVLVMTKEGYIEWKEMTDS